MKKCPSCGVDKKLSEYYRDSHQSNGYRSQCKLCTCEKQRRYRAENPKYTAREWERLQKWKLDNPYLAKTQKKRKRHRDSLERSDGRIDFEARGCIVCGNGFFVENHQLHTTCSSECSVINERATERLRKNRRKARKKQLPATLTAAEWADTLECFEYGCAYCGAPWEHQDHLVPVAKNGGYVRENVVPRRIYCTRWEYIR